MAPDVDALVARMAALLAAMDGDGDPARFFLGTYLRTTRAVAAALDARPVRGPAWVSRLGRRLRRTCYLDALRRLPGRRPGGPASRGGCAFGARPGLPPEAHVLLGMNAHINFDLPLSLLAMISPEEFADPFLLDRRRRDHERIDGVLAAGWPRRTSRSSGPAAGAASSTG